MRGPSGARIPGGSIKYHILNLKFSDLGRGDDKYSEKFREITLNIFNAPMKGEISHH